MHFTDFINDEPYERPANRASLLEQLEKDPGLLALYEDCFQWWYKTSSNSKCFRLLGWPDIRTLTLSEKLDIMETVHVLKNRERDSPYIEILDYRIAYPPSFAPFIHVVDIDLASDSTEFIPTHGLENCIQLESYAIEAPFKKIEVDFSHLPTEIHLSLRGLQTLEIPQYIIDNPKIVSLDLGSDLGNIPAIIRKFKGTHLSLRYPNASFESYLFNLPNLTSIRLALKNIPSQVKDIGVWKNFTSLYLDCPTLRVIPEWIRQMKQLNYLDIIAWRISELPFWLFDLPISEFRLDSLCLTQERSDAFEKALADYLAPLSTKERWYKLHMFGNVGLGVYTEEELRNLELQEYTEKIAEKINALQSLSRTLLIREQIELSFLTKIQAADNLTALQTIETELNTTITDVELIEQLQKYILEKKGFY